MVLQYDMNFANPGPWKHEALNVLSESLFVSKERPINIYDAKFEQTFGYSSSPPEGSVLVRDFEFIANPFVLALSNTRLELSNGRYYLSTSMEGLRGGVIAYRLSRGDFSNDVSLFEVVPRMPPITRSLEELFDQYLAPEMRPAAARQPCPSRQSASLTVVGLSAPIVRTPAPRVVPRQPASPPSSIEEVSEELIECLGIGVNGAEDEEAVDRFLLCPITQQTIHAPGKGPRCQHAQCFDIGMLFAMCAKKPHSEPVRCPCTCKEKFLRGSVVYDEKVADLISLRRLEKKRMTQLARGPLNEEDEEEYATLAPVGAVAKSLLMLHKIYGITTTASSSSASSSSSSSPPRALKDTSRSDPIAID